MPVEILVFRREESIPNDFRNGLNVNKDAPLDRIFGQQTAVTCMHTCCDGRFVVLKLGVIGQVLTVRPEYPDHRAPGEKAAEHEKTHQVSKNTQHIVRARLS